MKKALLCFTVVAALTFMVTACNSGTSGGYPFQGTWYLGIAGVDDLIFTSTTFSASGSFGTLGCSIEAVDTTANHIQMVVTSAGTNLYFAYTNGTTIYMTYSVSGNTLNFGYSTSSYPSSASGNGPYTRQ